MDERYSDDWNWDAKDRDCLPGWVCWVGTSAWTMDATRNDSFRHFVLRRLRDHP